MNIRLAGQDLRRLRAIALRQGIPYQTLLSSVPHRFAAGDLVQRGG